MSRNAIRPSGASRRCRLAEWGLATRQRWGAEGAIEMSLTSKREEQEWMGHLLHLAGARR